MRAACRTSRLAQMGLQAVAPTESEFSCACDAPATLPTPLHCRLMLTWAARHRRCSGFGRERPPPPPPSHPRCLQHTHVNECSTRCLPGLILYRRRLQQHRSCGMQQPMGPGTSRPQRRLLAAAQQQPRWQQQRVAAARRRAALRAAAGAAPTADSGTMACREPRAALRRAAAASCGRRGGAGSSRGAGGRHRVGRRSSSLHALRNGCQAVFR